MAHKDDAPQAKDANRDLDDVATARWQGSASAPGQGSGVSDELELDFEPKFAEGPPSASPGRDPMSRERLSIPPAPPRRRWRTAAVLLSVSIVLAATVAGVAYFIVGKGELSGGLFGDSEVLLLVRPSPRWARLYVDGERQKSTSLQLSRSRGSVVLRGEAKGYRTRQIVVDLSTTRTVRLVLQPLGQTRRRRSARIDKASAAVLEAGRAVTSPGQLDKPAKLVGKDGRPTRAAVGALLRTLNAPMAACYRRLGRAGLLTLEVTLRPNGETKARVRGSFAGTKTGRCAEAAAATLKGPTFSGEALEVSFPFRLGAGDREKAPVE